MQARSTEHDSIAAPYNYNTHSYEYEFVLISMHFLGHPDIVWPGKMAYQCLYAQSKPLVEPSIFLSVHNHHILTARNVTQKEEISHKKISIMEFDVI
jgi:hypothetical protein